MQLQRGKRPFPALDPLEPAGHFCDLHTAFRPASRAGNAPGALPARDARESRAGFARIPRGIRAARAGNGAQEHGNVAKTTGFISIYAFCVLPWDPDVCELCIFDRVYKHFSFFACFHEIQKRGDFTFRQGL